MAPSRPYAHIAAVIAGLLLLIGLTVPRVSFPQQLVAEAPSHKPSAALILTSGGTHHDVHAIIKRAVVPYADIITSVHIWDSPGADSTRAMVRHPAAHAALCPLSRGFDLQTTFFSFLSAVGIRRREHHDPPRAPRRAGGARAPARVLGVARGFLLLLGQQGSRRARSRAQPARGLRGRHVVKPEPHRPHHPPAGAVWHAHHNRPCAIVI